MLLTSSLLRCNVQVLSDVHDVFGPFDDHRPLNSRYESILCCFDNFLHIASVEENRFRYIDLASVVIPLWIGQLLKEPVEVLFLELKVVAFAPIHLLQSLQSPHLFSHILHELGLPTV